MPALWWSSQWWRQPGRDYGIGILQAQRLPQLHEASFFCSQLLQATTDLWPVCLQCLCVLIIRQLGFIQCCVQLLLPCFSHGEHALQAAQSRSSHA